MLFDVKVKEPDGQITTWTWGTNSCQVTDSKGVRRNPKKQGWVPIVDKAVTKRETTWQLEFMTGYNCNLNCSYCYQKDDRKHYKGVNATSKYVPQILEMLKKEDLPIREVLFYGGEPLVYFKVLKDFVPQLRELYPKAEFQVVTNGTLITEEVVDWAKENRVFLSISCDGRPDERGFDLLTVKKRILTYAYEKLGEEMCLMPVAGPGCEDYGETVRLIQAVLPKVHINPPSPVRYMKPDSFYENRKPIDLKKVEETFYEAMVNGTSTGAKWRLKRTIGYINRRAQSEFRVGGCPPARGGRLCLDFAGNIFPCHADATRIVGHLSNWREAAVDGFIKGEDRPGCKECPFIVMCHSVCAKISPETFEATCANFKASSRAAFRAAWKVLYNVDVLDITPHMEE